MLVVVNSVLLASFCIPTFLVKAFLVMPAAEKFGSRRLDVERLCAAMKRVARRNWLVRRRGGYER